MLALIQTHPVLYPCSHRQRSELLIFYNGLCLIASRDAGDTNTDRAVETELALEAGSSVLFPLISVEFS